MCSSVTEVASEANAWQVVFESRFENVYKVSWEGATFRNADARTLAELDRVSAQAFDYFGEEWPNKFTAARVSAETPASNISTTAKLVGSTEIRAVFDPDLDNASLDTITNILSLTGSVAVDLRLLGSESTAQGKLPRLTKSFVTFWFSERGIGTGAVRLVPPRTEHRRFMLLSGGQSLLLGMSLNSSAKNEAIRLEPDTEDRPFFESVWTTSKDF